MGPRRPVPAPWLGHLLRYVLLLGGLHFGRPGDAAAAALPGKALPTWPTSGAGRGERRGMGLSHDFSLFFFPPEACVLVLVRVRVCVTGFLKIISSFLKAGEERGRSAPGGVGGPEWNQMWREAGEGSPGVSSRLGGRGRAPGGPQRPPSRTTRRRPCPGPRDLQGAPGGTGGSFQETPGRSVSLLLHRTDAL